MTNARADAGERPRWEGGLTDTATTGSLGNFVKHKIYTNRGIDGVAMRASARAIQGCR